ncbi:MAG: type II secretion system protein [Candidatus Saccharimonadales bacterium]
MKALRRPAAARRAPLGADGFTITEIMIVLAVAAVILMIVFGAVPALQRGSRNGQRKQDIQTILEAVSQYELNDSGKFPDDCGGGGHTACTQTGGSTPNDYFLRFSVNKLTFYTRSTQVVSRNQTSGNAVDQGPNIDPATVDVYNYALCPRSGGKTTYYGAGYSDVVALYAVETGNNGVAAQCQQL